MSDRVPLEHPCIFQATAVIRQWKNGLTGLEVAEMKKEGDEMTAIEDSRRPNGTAGISQETTNQYRSNDATAG